MIEVEEALNNTENLANKSLAFSVKCKKYTGYYAFSYWLKSDIEVQVLKMYLPNKHQRDTPYERKLCMVILKRLCSNTDRQML